VKDVSEYAATEIARLVQQVIDSTGMVSEIEDFNAVQAWLGSLPGHAYANVRRPIVSSLNLCDLIPLSSVWPGAAWNRHLDGPALIQTRTHGSTPFRLSLH
jgi:type IV secretion system protein VirB4